MNLIFVKVTVNVFFYGSLVACVYAFRRTGKLTNELEAVDKRFARPGGSWHFLVGNSWKETIPENYHAKFIEFRHMFRLSLVFLILTITFFIAIKYFELSLLHDFVKRVLSRTTA